MTASTLNLELAASAAVYPQKVDGSSVLLIRLSEADYRHASFLDDRILSQQTEGHWFPYADVAARAVTAIEHGPLHFIFHSGHVGSTLLSRLLDEEGSILNLREPLPLRTLAEMHDRAMANPNASEPRTFGDRLVTFLRLWRRGFARTRMVVIKTTSTTGRLAETLLAARADARAVYLNVSLQSYMATLLAGANAALDLRGFAAERKARLRRLLAADSIAIDEHSVGALAAAAWLTERLTQQRAKEALGARLLEVDFDSFLAEQETTLLKLARHFAIPDPDGFADRAARSPIWTRYSKAPQEYAYSPALRADLLKQALGEHAGEVAEGLTLVQSLAARFPAAAQAL